MSTKYLKFQRSGSELVVMSCQTKEDAHAELYITEDNRIESIQLRRLFFTGDSTNCSKERALDGILSISIADGVPFGVASLLLPHFQEVGFRLIEEEYELVRKQPRWEVGICLADDEITPLEHEIATRFFTSYLEAVRYRNWLYRVVVSLDEAHPSRKNLYKETVFMKKF